MAEIQRWSTRFMALGAIFHDNDGDYLLYSDHVADKAAAVEKVEAQRDALLFAWVGTLSPEQVEQGLVLMGIDMKPAYDKLQAEICKQALEDK